MVDARQAEALACKTPAELKAFIESIGCGTKQRWNRAVAAIIEIGGPDYYALRGETRAATANQLRRTVTHAVELFVDAKARCERFAICDAAGEVAWFGRFFEDDQSFSYGDRNEQSACECAAARKAIWFASKIKEAIGATALRLNLKVDAQWLCTGGGKAAILQSDARRFNIELNVEWISGTSNPADKWTVATGFKKWSDNRLERFAMPVDPVAEKAQQESDEADEAAAEEAACAAATLDRLRTGTTAGINSARNESSANSGNER